MYSSSLWYHLREQDDRGRTEVKTVKYDNTCKGYHALFTVLQFLSPLKSSRFLYILEYVYQMGQCGFTK